MEKTFYVQYPIDWIRGMGYTHTSTGVPALIGPCQSKGRTPLYYLYISGETSNRCNRATLSKIIEILERE